MSSLAHTSPAYLEATRWRRIWQRKSTAAFNGLPQMREALVADFPPSIGYETLQQVETWLVRQGCRKNGEDFAVILPMKAGDPASVMITNPHRIRAMLGRYKPIADSVEREGDGDIPYRRNLEEGQWSIRQRDGKDIVAGRFSDAEVFMKAMAYLSAKHYLAHDPAPATRVLREEWSHGEWRNAKIVSYAILISPERAKDFQHEFPRLGIGAPEGQDFKALPDDPHTLWRVSHAEKSRARDNGNQQALFT